jgi:hypothetical protein
MRKLAALAIVIISTAPRPHLWGTGRCRRAFGDPPPEWVGVGPLRQGARLAMQLKAQDR